MKLTDYRGANLFDELVDAQGAIRPYYRGVADKLAGLGPEELGHKLRSLELLFLKQGITFTVYGDEQGTERVFPFDPFPRVIPHHEWETIEAGLVQRLKIRRILVRVPTQTLCRIFLHLLMRQV